MRNYSNIPDYLKECGLFCFADSNKVPINPRTYGNAMPNNPDTFSSYEYAVSNIKDGYHLGIGLFNVLCGIDIDDCVTDGALSSTALDIIHTVNSYTEYSVSGNGIHILFLCKNHSFNKDKYYTKKSKQALTKDGINGIKSLEVYFPGATNRYLTVTGNTIIKNIVSVDYSVIEGMLDKYMLKPKKETQPQDRVQFQESATADIQYALAHDSTLAMLWHSLPSGHGGNESETDLALMNKLAYWCNGDADAMNDAFVSSPYFQQKDREHKRKWERDDYRLSTIGMAIEGVSKQAYDYQVQRSVSPMKQETVPQESIDIESHKLKKLFKDFCTYVGTEEQHTIVPTGFPCLDKFIGGGLYPKLYTINAMPSLGKTTFTLQVADNIARSGYDVIVFSLEMANEDLIARSISRGTFLISPSKAKSENEVINGAWYKDYTQEEIEIINKAQADYFNACAEHISIYDGKQTAKDIRNIVKQYIEQTGNKPVVIVDYLQIITPDSTMLKTERRTQVINDVDILNSIKREYKCPVIVISSVSRGNYYTEMGMDSGKESGEIEYTADCCINLSYDVSAWYKDKNGFEKKTDKDTMELKIRKAQKEIPRHILLSLEKNRGGEIGKQVAYRYYPKYNVFIEDTVATEEKNK